MLEESRIEIDLPDEGEALGLPSVEKEICMASVAQFFRSRPKTQEDQTQTVPVSGSLAR